jgi:hypothetical protein
MHTPRSLTRLEDAVNSARHGELSHWQRGAHGVDARTGANCELRAGSDAGRQDIDDDECFSNSASVSEQLRRHRNPHPADYRRHRYPHQPQQLTAA